jgi:hypothetical protein
VQEALNQHRALARAARTSIWRRTWWTEGDDPKLQFHRTALRALQHIQDQLLVPGLTGEKQRIIWDDWHSLAECHHAAEWRSEYTRCNDRLFYHAARHVYAPVSDRD